MKLERKRVPSKSNHVIFPKSACVVFFLLENEERVFTLYPMTLLYNAIEEIRSAAVEIEKEMFTRQHMIVNEIALMLPVSFERLYPLKKHHWENPLVHYDNRNRIHGFWPVALYPRLYKVVVIPYHYKDRTYFEAVIPVYANNADKHVQQFMLCSDYPVNTQIKDAAIYAFGEHFRLNWQTGEISQEESIMFSKSVD